LIDPNNITDFTRNRPALEELVLFATMVPTKPAHRTARLLETMLANARLTYGDQLSPFDIVRLWIGSGCLGQVIRRYGVGQYTRIERCWRELVEREPIIGRRTGNDPVVRYVKQVDLRSVEQLEQIHGIGPKTARFIVLHSVAGARCIPVDTHWVKELLERGYPIKVSVNERGQRVVSVNDRTHPIYEAYALAEVDRSGMSAAEYDLLIWRKWNEATQRRAA
jgi:hypothetical protein